MSRTVPATSSARTPPVRIGVSVTNLTKLSRDFRDVSKTMQLDFAKALKTAVQPVVDQAKANASFSKRIPSSIRVVSTGGKAKVRIQVRAGGAKAPEAVAFEGPGDFYHPLFGNKRHWYPQASHPYLLRALAAKADDVATDVGVAIDKYLRAHGL